MCTRHTASIGAVQLSQLYAYLLHVYTVIGSNSVFWFQVAYNAYGQLSFFLLLSPSEHLKFGNKLDSTVAFTYFCMRSLLLLDLN
jgi:hypothetical protein